MMIRHTIPQRDYDRLGFKRGVLLVGLLVWGGAWGGSPSDDPAAVLERGREVRQARARLIADYTAWARELASGPAVLREAAVPMENSADPAAEFVSYIQRLTRLHAVEALDLGVEYVGLVATDSQGRPSRPAVELLAAIGRPASLTIAARLRSDSGSPALREILETIEGDSSGAVLGGAVPSTSVSPEARPAPVAVEGALPIEFIQIPGIPQPGYSGHGTETVLDLAAGLLRDGPTLDAVPMTREQFAPVVEEVGRKGDLAVAGNLLLIPSGRFALIASGDLQAMGDAKLPPVAALGGNVLGLERDRIVQIATRDDKRALIQYLGSSRHEPLLAYVVQPNGTATFPTAPLASPWSVRSRAGVSSGALMAHGAFIHDREMRFWTNYGRTAEALGRIVAGETPSASQAEREEALALLGELRHEESAGVMVQYLAADADAASRRVDHPAVRALAAIWPVPRRAVVELIEATEDRYLRARLTEVLERLDGPASAPTPRDRPARGPARSKSTRR